MSSTPGPDQSRTCGVRLDGQFGCRVERPVPVRYERCFSVALGPRLDRHPRHDEHHQPRAWRAHDDGSLCGDDRCSTRGAVSTGCARGFCRRRNLRRRSRTVGSSSFLWPGVRRTRGDLGHQPDPVAGVASHVRAVHAVDSDSRRIRQRRCLLVFRILACPDHGLHPGDPWPLVALQPHHFWPSGPGDDAKCGNGACAGRQYGS